MSDLSESVGHSLTSAFRPVMFKQTFEREDPVVVVKAKPEMCSSPETGCSEVSTTVDKDEPSNEEQGQFLRVNIGFN